MYFLVAFSVLSPGALKAFHLLRMPFHMKTTLIIDDSVMARLKQRAVKEGKTISALVESALRMFLEPRGRKGKALPPCLLSTTGGRWRTLRIAMSSTARWRTSSFHRFPFLEVIDPLV